MKILIVDDDKDIRDIIEFTLSCDIESDFIHAESGNSAIEIIKETSDLDLVICDYNMPDGNGGVVYRYLLESENPLPFVFCSSDFSQDHDDFIDKKNLLDEITKPYIYDGVQKVIESFSNLDKVEEGLTKNDSPYINIGLDLLLRSKILPCPLFVKLSSGKILKMLNEGEQFTSEEYDKYSTKGVEYLLIEKEQGQKYIEAICDDVMKILEDKTTSEESKVFDAHSIIMKTVSQLGLSETVVKAASRGVDFALHFFQDNQDFKKLEKHIFQASGNYLTKHSVALSFIAAAILKNSTWNSPETRNKLVLAGFLHDATIRTTNFNESYFSDDNDLLSLKEHPTEVLDLINKVKNLPPDLDRILLEHHERPDGSGYPRKLSASQIHPLSSVFILAHDVVDTIFKLQLENIKISDEILQKEIFDETYGLGHFKKSLEAFRKTKLFE